MINILFLCTANSTRSQVAEGLGEKYLADVAHVSSAGSHPAKVNPMAIEVLKEIDIDISNHKSKSIDSIDKDKIDLVITLCAEEVCPVFPGNVKRLHWPFPDPASPKFKPDEKLELLRWIRDTMIKQIQTLKEEIKTWKKESN